MPEPLFGSPRLSVVPFAEEDFPEALAVYRQCEDFLALGPVPRASAAMVREDIAHSRDEGGVYCMVRGVGGEACGILDFVPRWRKEGTAFLSLLMIGAPYRGFGLGSEAVCLLEDHLRTACAARIVESGVQVNNAAAVRFWTGRGYRIVSGPERLPDTTVCYGLRKEL